MPQPVYCTKIASRLARTYTDKHGLKDLTRDVLGIDVSKQQQLTDWGAEKLTDAQVAYAAAPVIKKYTGILAAADVYTASTAFILLESIRLDLGAGSQVHP